MKHRIKKLFTDEYEIIACLIATVFGYFLGNGSDRPVVILGFLVSMAVVMITLSMRTAQIKDDLCADTEQIRCELKKIAEYVSLENAVLFDSCSQSKLDDAISSIRDQITHVKVICYGSGSYGGFLPRLSKEGKEIEVILCDPRGNHLAGSLMDADYLEDHVKKIEKYRNTKVIRSKIFPTIRASLYIQRSGDREQYLLCAIQAYVFASDPNEVVEGESYTPMILLQRDNPNMQSGVEFFLKEFERLKTSSMDDSPTERSVSTITST